MTKLSSSRTIRCVELLRFCGEALGSIYRQPFELNGADEVERRMTPDGIIEAIDVTGDGLLGLGAGLEGGAPDEFGLQRLEERLDHRVVVTIPLARHRDQDAVAA